MDSFDISATQIITSKLKIILNRELKGIEFNAFSISRSGMAYEMIDDYVSDEKKSKDEIEDYVKSVVDEFLRPTGKS